MLSGVTQEKSSPTARNFLESLSSDAEFNLSVAYRS